MQAALEAAKQTLNFKKRFIVSALEDKSSRAADDAVSRVEQFEQELAKHAEAVASDPAYDKELRDFLAKAKTDAAIKKNVADAEYKVQSWRSVIRRTESSLDDELKNPRGYCNPKEWERVLSEKREFQPLPELESLCKDWSSFIAEFPEMEKKIVGKLRAVELAGEWRNEGGVLEGWVTRSLPRDIRNARENPSPRNADTLQKCVENAKEALSKVDRARWADYPKAVEVIATLEKLIDEAFEVMDAADGVGKAKDAAGDAKKAKEVQDKIKACAKPIADVLLAGKCSYAATKNVFKRQPYYSCFTCGDGYGVCVTCKEHCHPKDHNISELKVGDFYCDHGHSGECKYLNAAAPPPGAAAVAAAPTCRNNHPLAKANRSARCDECSASIYESFNCSKCDYDCCLACFAKKTPAQAAAAPVVVIQCNKGHPLTPVTRSCRCDVCGTGAEESHNCRQCDFDMCTSCYRNKVGSASAAPRAVAAVAPAASAPAGPESSFVKSDGPEGWWTSKNGYSTTTYEKWVDGSSRLPVGRFDCSNRRCESKVSNVLETWNSGAKDFNRHWEEATVKYFNQFGKEPQFEWLKDRLDGELNDLESELSFFRRVEDRMGAELPGGANHPAAKKASELIEAMFEAVRDFREKGEAAFEKERFAAEVAKPMKNARAAIAEGLKNKDFVDGSMSIDGYDGEHYSFEGRYQYENCDVFRVALKECAIARSLLEEKDPNHPLLKEVDELEDQAKREHIRVCVKWGEFYAKHDEHWQQEKAEKYAVALEDVDRSPFVETIRNTLAKSREATAKKREAEEAAARIEQEKRDKEHALYIAKMQDEWLRKYEGGGTIYVGKEKFFYSQGGRVEGHDLAFDWTGTSFEGSVEGYGSWNGGTFEWTSESRTVYAYSFTGNKFTVDHRNNKANVPNWSWNGVILSAENDADAHFKERSVRFDGKVPVPVLLALAMRLYANRRCSELQGRNVCKSALFGEGVHGLLCDNCSTNYSAKCAVCSDGLPFPRNEAHMCKYCANSHSRSCMRCDRNGSVAAFVCDPCRYKFGEGYCVRTTRQYDY